MFLSNIRQILGTDTCLETKKCNRTRFICRSSKQTNSMSWIVLWAKIVIKW